MPDSSDTPHPKTVRGIILAAGKSTRMKSKTPKVLHPLRGKLVIEHVLDAVSGATETQPLVVIGAAADEMRAAISHRASCVLQEPQLGTGHAVMAAGAAVAEAAVVEAIATGTSNFLVAAGDMPLLRTETYTSLITQRQTTGAAITLLTVRVDNPRGFGRIVRDAQNRVQAIVEEVACTPEQLKIRELNLAVYCFDGAWLWPALKRITPNSKKGEYFLTDLVELAAQDGREVHATVVEDADECIGINTRVDLADADAALRKRINKQHMLNGVSIVDPSSTYIDIDVKIDQDAIIWPNTHVLGQTKIGNESVIGPNSLLVNAVIGARVEIRQSVIRDSQVDDDADVGPFSHLRNGAHVGAGAHVGNFAEIKKSTLGRRSKMGHFSYLGDATVGEDANLGAGMITANYDGANKHETHIGDHAFIGSDTILRAPVSVGHGAVTGAGAVVIKDVPENALVVGIPARMIKRMERKEGRKK